MTKDMERDLLSKFVAGLPSESYLGDIFKEIVPMILQAISSDMPFISYRELLSEKIDMEKQVIEASKRVSLLQAEIDTRKRTLLTQQRDIDRLNDMMASVREKAAAIADFARKNG
jgi:hypothetical protein